MLKYAALFLTLALAAPAARAAITINVGNHPLYPGTAGQVVVIDVTGGDLVQGDMIQVQVEDGGPLAGGQISGPVITKIDVLTGTIFSNNNTLQRDPGVIAPQLASAGTTTASGSVSANGHLVRLTFDATSQIEPWTVYHLYFGGTKTGDTVFGDIHPTIINGTLTITPEPATGLLAVAGAALLLRRRRHAPRSAA